jgi:hypothetical protein
MKKKLFISITIIFATITNAQYISVELSIEWQQNLTYSIKELECKDIKPVYLTIKYRNISNKPLYFSKITKGIYDLPDFVLGYSENYKKNWRFPYYQNDTCKPYYTIGLNQEPFYFSWFSWNVKKDTVCNDKYFTVHSCIAAQGESSIIENKDDGLFMNLNNIYTDIYNRFYSEFIDKDLDGTSQLKFSSIK